MGRFRSDVRYAARVLTRSPLFTLAAVATLALGIGASTAVFSVVDGILFRPLDLPDSDRLVTICETHPSVAGYCIASPPNVADWAERARSLAAIGIARDEAAAIRIESDIHLITAGLATPALFHALGVTPLLGRLPIEDDLPPRGGGHVVALTEGFWRTDLGGDPGILGRSILLDDEAYTVVGVLPEAVVVPRFERVRLWKVLPFDPRSEEHRDWRGFAAIARLSSGTSVERAEAELTAIQEELAEVHPEALRGWGVRVEGLRDHIVADVRPTLLVFLGAVAVVLLIVCVNMASLLLARTSGRAREMAVRTAIGAGRGTLVRQLLVESGLLALLGGVGGAIVAHWMTSAFIGIAPAGIPRIDEVTVDGRVLAFTLVTTALSGLLFGLAPALRAGAVVPADALRGGRGQAGHPAVGRLRRGLVVAQVALALVLVFSATLLLRSFAGLLDWRPGFDTDHLLTFQIFASPGRYPESEQVLALYRRIEEEVRALPGATSAGTASAGPLFGGGDGASRFLVEGRGEWTRESAPSALWFDAGPGYFATLGIPLLAGRGFEESDAGGAPVVVINEAMARRFWPDGDPVGARLTFPELDRAAEVVGVVRDIPSFFPGRPAEPQVYFSNRQWTRWASYFVVRSAGDPVALARAVGAAVERVDPAIRPRQTLTMGERVSAQLVRPRFNTVLIGVFAAVALMLGAIGIYGVIAYTTGQRTREIGIRVALGADRGRILRSVLGDGVGLILRGAAIGAVAALASGRLLSDLLYGIAPADPWSLAAAFSVLLLTGAAAAFVPARRASRVDPAQTLRQE